MSFFTTFPEGAWDGDDDLGVDEWLGAEREKEGAEKPELLEGDDALGAENIDLDGAEKEFPPA